MQRVLLFQAGNRQFAADLPHVVSIHGMDALITEQSDRMILPMLMTDSEKAPVIDLANVLNQPALSDNRSVGKIMLLNTQIALKADRIDGIVSVEEDQIRPIPPVFKGKASDCFPKVLRYNNTLILMIDPEGIKESQKAVARSQKTAEDISQQKTTETTAQKEMPISQPVSESIQQEESEFCRHGSAPQLDEQPETIYKEVLEGTEESDEELLRLTAELDQMPAIPPGVPTGLATPDQAIPEEDDEIIDLTEDMEIPPDQVPTEQTEFFPEESKSSTIRNLERLSSPHRLSEEMLEQLLTNAVQHSILERAVLGVADRIINQLVTACIQKVKTIIIEHSSHD